MYCVCIYHFRSKEKYFLFRFIPKQTGSTSYLYITIVTVISTLFSLYGTMVIFRASKLHLKQYMLMLKYMSFKILLVLINVQNLVFGILAAFDLPECIGTRGPKVRGSCKHTNTSLKLTFPLKVGDQLHSRVIKEA